MKIHGVSMESKIESLVKAKQLQNKRKSQRGHNVYQDTGELRDEAIDDIYRHSLAPDVKEFKLIDAEGVDISFSAAERAGHARWGYYDAPDSIQVQVSRSKNIDAPAVTKTEREGLSAEMGGGSSRTPSFVDDVDPEYALRADSSVELDPDLSPITRHTDLEFEYPEKSVYQGPVTDKARIAAEAKAMSDFKEKSARVQKGHRGLTKSEFAYPTYREKYDTLLANKKDDILIREPDISNELLERDAIIEVNRDLMAIQAKNRALNDRMGIKNPEVGVGTQVGKGGQPTGGISIPANELQRITIESGQFKAIPSVQQQKVMDELKQFDIDRGYVKVGSTPLPPPPSARTAKLPHEFDSAGNVIPGTGPIGRPGRKEPVFPKKTQNPDLLEIESRKRKRDQVGDNPLDKVSEVEAALKAGPMTPNLSRSHVERVIGKKLHKFEVNALDSKDPDISGPIRRKLMRGYYEKEMGTNEIRKIGSSLRRELTEKELSVIGGSNPTAKRELLTKLRSEYKSMSSDVPHDSGFSAQRQAEEKINLAKSGLSKEEHVRRSKEFQEAKTTKPFRRTKKKLRRTGKSKPEKFEAAHLRLKREGKIK